MKRTVKWLGGFVALSLVMVLFGFVFLKINGIQKSISPVASTQEKREITVVLDAGHGGEDGGCSGTDGTLEKDLNLSVTKKVYDILTASGISVGMTRSEDEMVYDMYGDLRDYNGHKKTYDLKNRVRYAAEEECEIFVSIHMNKFSSPQYKGLQVYYSPNDSDSITAAGRVQKYVRDYLQPENEREIKKAGSNIYVLNRSQMPAILVECGFLSNGEDLQMLKDPEYQKKLALCISAGIVDALANFREK